MGLSENEVGANKRMYHACRITTLNYDFIRLGLGYLVYYLLHERHGLRVARADGLGHLRDVAQVPVLRELQRELQMTC